jgi:CspA family cold shock protein
MTQATVVEWRNEEGWGVLSVPGLGAAGIWTHFSVVEMEGFVTLSVGQTVDVEFEDLGSPYQDGYRYRATRLRPRP